MHGRLFQFDLSSISEGLVMPFPSYFVLLLAGFLLATVMGAIWAKRVGQNPDVVVDLGLAMVLAGVAGGRLLHVLADGHFMEYVNLCIDPAKVDWQITQAQCRSADYNGVWDFAKQVCHPQETDCWGWARFYAGGLTYYGGFAAASTAAWFLLRADKFPFWKAADMAGMVVPIGLGFGRMGCLLAGCCFGKPWASGLAIHFPAQSPASEAQFKGGLLPTPLAESLEVHPTQIYESAASFAIAAFLIFHFHGKKRYDGQVFLAFVGLYSVLRFVIEFVRADDRGGFFGLSTSQLVGIPLVGLVVWLHKRLEARSAERFKATTQPPSAEPPSAEPPPAAAPA
jgi:phosphatidylglycerol---prolipoprotein diacylglyceryl transferase